MESKAQVKIGVITAADPNDKRILSGTLHCMCEALKSQFSSVIYLGPVKLSPFSSLKVRILTFLFKIFHLLVYWKRLNSEHTMIRSKFHAGYFKQMIEGSGLDVLFAPFASIELAFIKTDVPICYLSDTSFAQLADYYRMSSKLSSMAKRMGDKIEHAAIHNSFAQVYSSKWAADFSREYYQAPNVFITRFGANMDSAIFSGAENKKPGPPLQLLFVGVDWVRKGGDIVFDTFLELLEKGHHVNLTVCGCNPPKSHPKVEVYTFLDKNKKEDLSELMQIFNRSDLFFLPTRADCTPIVFCEANAFGLPVISTNTGGVSSIIEDGNNGFLLSPDAKSKEYTELIERIINEEGLYQKLSVNARNKFEKELNWTVWAKEMRQILLLTQSRRKEQNSYNL